MPEIARHRLFPQLELVHLPLGKVLYEPGGTIRHAYFPVDSIVSLVYVIESGAPAEIAMVGSEGLVGICLFMGGGIAPPRRAVVSAAGYAYRLAGQRLRDEFDCDGDVMQLLLRYTQYLMTQIAQTAVCNRHHTIEQRLSAWLLNRLDRLPTNKMTITHDLISHSLGVRRESVTHIAGKLHALGIIDCWRGHLRVLDRAGLEDLACECFAVVRHESSRLRVGNHQVQSGCSVHAVTSVQDNSLRCVL